MSAVDDAPRTASGGAGDVVRAGARGVGELLITAGLVLLLFVAYQLVWTNVEAQRAQGKVADQIRESWSRPTGPGPAARPGTVGPGDSDFGRGFAFLHVPRLGDRFSVPVLEGVALDVLARGVGHYPRSAMPGEPGNFAVAGHRATNGEPFADLDRMRRGDVIVVETRNKWLTYVVDKTQVVLPTDVWVIDPVPGRVGVKPRRKLLTLTTCNPRWASYERLVVFGHLERERKKSDGPPDELLRRS